MLRSFFNAVTGMDTSRFWLDVVSDNLANSNTVGFKASRPIFQEMVSQVIVGLNTTTGTIKTTTFGAGAITDSTQKLWTIGNFKQTDITTDLAIEGKALFILRDAITNQQYYTRDGRFRINREGYLINPNGLYVQGFKVDPVTGEVVGTQLEDIRIETQIQPKATGITSFLQPTNLDARAPIITANFDPLNPNTYNYRYTITIYDSLGNEYQANIYFKKAGTNQWKIFLLSDYDGDNQLENLISDALADNQENGYNFITLTYDVDGKLIDDAGDKIESVQVGEKRIFYVEIFNSTNQPQDGLNTAEGGQLGNLLEQYNFNDPNQMILILGEAPASFVPNAGNTIPTSYITQHASDFVVTMDQDGYARGELIDVYVLSEDGIIVGVYSNGETLPMYRVALAQFTDPEELVRKGANLYASVKPPTILLPGGANKIRSGMVEMSNVDIAKEFINLITAQRTYQANARIITSANTILEDTINLVR